MSDRDTATKVTSAAEQHGVSIGFEEVSKWFRPKGSKDVVHALDRVSFDVAPGEFVSVIGPSGCGKSTLLRIVHGLAAADGGHARVDGVDVTAPSSRCAMVFQGVNLFPWRTAVRNVEFGLEMRGVPASARRKRALELLELTGLSGFEGSFPGQLSGGMQQRVGLARALAVDPDALFMDEPFGALDAQTKVLMQAELDRLVREFGKTVIFVTHDMEEAVFLSDRVIVMSARPGRVLADVRIGLPRPRTDEMRKSVEFGELKDRIWELLRSQQETGAPPVPDARA
jgi:NitT/TauT family transport system ATP-binding protein